MSNDRAKYCVWLDSNKSSPVTFSPAQNSLAKTNVLFNIRFPQLPKFEKFLLRLESFALQTPDTTGNPVTNVSLNRKLDASGVANPNCFKFVMPRGWSTQSMVGATPVGGNVPEPRVILGTLNAASYAGATLMSKGVVVSRGDQPTVVVDRPNVNGTYEVVLECPDGGYFCLGDKAAPLVIGNWTACLSLTPMTNEDLKNWDGRP